MRAQGARGLSPAVRVCTRGYVRTCLCCVWYRHVCVHVCVVLNVVYAHVCCVVWGVPAGYMRTRVLCARVCCVCLCTWGKPSEVPNARDRRCCPGRSVRFPPGTCSAPCWAPTPASRPAPRRTAGPRGGGAARTHLPAPRTACTATLWREREKPLLGASGKATRSSDGPARLTLTAALLTRSAGWLASHTATVEAYAQRPQDEALSPSGPVRTPSQAASTRRS